MKDIIYTAFATGISGQAGGLAGDQTFESAIGPIIQAIIGVIGVVAVIFIIVGAVNYTMSQGDPGKVKKARDTILYAVIGLIVALLSFAIVTFILDKMKATDPVKPIVPIEVEETKEEESPE